MAKRRATEGIRSLSVALLVLAAAMFASGGAARAAAPAITHFSVTPSSTQAGGHPDVEVKLAWVNEFGNTAARVFRTHFPEGFVGNPHVPPKCTLTQLSQGVCPVDAQIGVFEIFDGFFMFPAYNMETRPDQAGLIASVIPLVGAPAFIDISGRTDSDYGLDSVSSPLIQGAGLSDFTFHLWGVPGDPDHDFQRFFTPLEGGGACTNSAEGCPPGTPFMSPTFASPSVPPEPFLQNPTTCGVSLTSSEDLEYYGGAEVHAKSPWPPTTGCHQLSFNPSQSVKPTTSQADTAAGIDAELKAPQTQSPTTPAPSQIKRITATLPQGFSINPGAADGKLACSDAETSIGTLLAARCPEFSKVGTLSLDVAALPGPIPGGIYLGEPKPGDPYRLILTADGFGTHAKQAASIRPDPQTGQLTTVFDLPQALIQQIDLHFFGSERGVLATSTQCGRYAVENEFVPWNSVLSTRFLTSYLTVDSGPGGKPCPNGPRPFAPRLAAGTANNTAGAHSPFSLTLDRDDGDQNLTGLDVTTPPGFAATLKGIPYCPEVAIALLGRPAHEGRDEQASPACPRASQIGRANAGAGAGTHPLYTPGKVYLAGPYKDAPLSLVVVIPAVSGPYDLGNVAVRAAIHVDPRSAQVTTVSDPLPQILEGIPLRTRKVMVDLDRPGFTLNPTDCDPVSVVATVTGSEGATSTQSTHFQVANCAELDFAPKLGLKLRGSTKRRGHPALRAVLRTGGGEANLDRTVVAMPRSVLLDNARIGAICTRAQFAAHVCPKGSIYGHATAFTPLLDQPLRGPVYLRSSSRQLPDLVIALKGQLDIELVGHIDLSKSGGIRTSFASIPDAPVSKFVLDLKGGSKGLLINSESLCRGTKRAGVSLVGQNGMRESRRTKLQSACGKRKAPRSRHRGRLFRAREVR